MQSNNQANQLPDIDILTNLSGLQEFDNDFSRNPPRSLYAFHYHVLVARLVSEII